MRADMRDDDAVRGAFRVVLRSYCKELVLRKRGWVPLLCRLAVYLTAVNASTDVIGLACLRLGWITERREPRASARVPGVKRCFVERSKGKVVVWEGQRRGGCTGQKSRGCDCAGTYVFAKRKRQSHGDWRHWCAARHADINDAQVARARGGGEWSCPALRCNASGCFRNIPLMTYMHDCIIQQGGTWRRSCNARVRARSMGRVDGDASVQTFGRDIR